jgi:hypothetical protein
LCGIWLNLHWIGLGLAATKYPKGRQYGQKPAKQQQGSVQVVGAVDHKRLTGNGLLASQPPYGCPADK